MDHGKDATFAPKKPQNFENQFPLVGNHQASASHRMFIFQLIKIHKLRIKP